MESSFFFISMWSAFGAFIITIALIRLGIMIAEMRGVRVWGEPTPQDPNTLVTALSDEQKEKIEKVRSSMILKHLSKFTLTINEENMTAVTTPNSAPEKESRDDCIPVEQADGEKDDEEEDEVDIEKGALITQYSHICVPLPGEQRDNSSSTIDNDDTATRKSRQVPNLCVICHEDYTPLDKVCWASSEDCTHVFHEECIVRWLTSLGWMKLKGQNNEPENMIEEEKCLNYDLECPMCRGEFICKHHEQEENTRDY